MTTFTTRDQLNDLVREFLQSNDLTWLDIKHYSLHQQHELQLKYMRWLLRELASHDRCL